MLRSVTGYVCYSVCSSLRGDSSSEMNGERVNNVDGDEATHANTYFHQEEKKNTCLNRATSGGRPRPYVSGPREGCRDRVRARSRTRGPCGQATRDGF